MGRFNRVMLWINLVAVLILLLAYIAPYVNPKVFWPLAFVGLAYPIMLFVNLFFAVYWLAQMRMAGIISLLAIGIGWNSLFSFIQFSLHVPPQNKDIKIMSYNCMLFDLYNWSHNTESRKNIFDMLQGESPDILCLQEFYTSEEADDFNNTDSLVRFLPAKNIHAEYTVTLRKKDHWGVITLTKYPILRKGKIVFHTHSNNIAIYTDMLINKDTVRVYNLHLASIHFGKKEYKLIDELMSDKPVNNEIEGSKNILKRIKEGFINRSDQVMVVANHIASCRYKKIICGDFNDTPSSFAYRKIKGDLRDAFIESGTGIGKSYAGKLPFLRIDYIFYDDDFKSYNYKRQSESFTDHYPISCYLRTRR